LTADVTFHINIGPLAAWAGALWIFWWVIVFVWHASAIKQQIENAKGVEGMARFQYTAPHLAPGPLIPVPRVDPATANIKRRYGTEEEDDEAIGSY
jgi:hypothetical protein